MTRGLTMMVWLFMYATGLSRKYALLGDTSQFVCRSDSLKQSFSQEYLAAIDPDSIATFHYWYDNGRYEHEIVAFIWRQRDDILIKALELMSFVFPLRAYIAPTCTRRKLAEMTIFWDEDGQNFSQ